MKSTPRHARLLGAVLMATLAAACGDAPEASPAGMQAGGELPEGHPPLESSPYAHQQEATQAGPAAVVLETQDVTGYTYARVRSEGEEIWVAGPQSELAVGDTISLGGAMGMTDFTSSELGRTFESILFLDAWRAPAAAEAPANRGEVLEAVSSDSYTYIRVGTDEGEVWLAGPRVAVEEGQVIAWGEGMPMRNFESKAMERTFDVILFVNGVQVVG